MRSELSNFSRLKLLKNNFELLKNSKNSIILIYNITIINLYGWHSILKGLFLKLCIKSVLLLGLKN